jgi:hypothetical protein
MIPFLGVYSNRIFTCSSTVATVHENCTRGNGHQLMRLENRLVMPCPGVTKCPMKLDLVVTSFMLATTIVRVFLFKSFMTKAKTDMAAELLSSLGKDHIGPTGLESR